MQTATAPSRVQIKKILFCTDFSPAAQAAVPFVKEVTKRYGADLFVLHVRPPRVNPMTPPAAWGVAEEQAEVEDLKHRAKLQQTFSEVPTQIIIEEGDIASNVLHEIKKDHIDLVVLGTHGRSGLGKLILGSAAEEIFRNAPCPVLTVGPHAHNVPKQESGWKKIIFATDFSDESFMAGRYAVSLAQEFQAHLTLLHVIPDRKSGDLVTASQIRTSCERLLAELVPPEAQAWCQYEQIVETGDAAEKVLTLAQEKDADLIVLGVHPETGIPGAATHLPIAVAHKIVAQATCPVLTVRHR